MVTIKIFSFLLKTAWPSDWPKPSYDFYFFMQNLEERGKWRSDGESRISF
jgi:hypothetical protein